MSNYFKNRSIIILLSIFAILSSLAVIESNQRLLNQALNEFISQTQSAKDQFKIWHYIHEKPYNLNSLFALERYKVFKSNLKMFEDHNNKNLGYYYGLNSFTDLTVEEFKAAYLTTTDIKDIESSILNNNDKNFIKIDDIEKISNDENMNSNASLKKVNFDALADEHDRDHNNDNNDKWIRKLDYNPYNEEEQVLKSLNVYENGKFKQKTCKCKCQIKGEEENQDKSEGQYDEKNRDDPTGNPERGSFSSPNFSIFFEKQKNFNLNGNTCKPSYVFSPVEVLEARYNMKFGQFISLSDQQVIDCNTWNYGCTSGHPQWSYAYFCKDAIPSEADYPFVGKKQTCNTAVKKVVLAKTWTSCVRFKDTPTNSSSYCSVDRINNLIRRYPYTAYIHALDNLMFYTKGIIPAKKCLNPNHAVSIVEVNRTDGYVQFKNNWGEKWGVNGFGKFKIEESELYPGAYACFALNNASTILDVEKAS